MISKYVEDLRTLARMHSSCIGSYLDDYVNEMATEGFRPLTIGEHLRSIVQLAYWSNRRGIELARWEEGILTEFRRHVRLRARSRQHRRIAHATRFFSFLRKRGLIAPARPVPEKEGPAILERFDKWMVKHRGVTTNTLYRYRRVISLFVTKLGQDPTEYDVKRIRSFVILQLGSRGHRETQEAVTALRSFFRFLIAEGLLRPGVEDCVPRVPHWRLSSLPRFLDAPDVERVLRSCDLRTGHGRRDFSILLLLSRLGLRAGDVVRMKLDDIDWQQGTLRVRGKSQREAVLPLPQDVGNAVLNYIQRGRPRSMSERIFLTVPAPTRPFASSSSISDIVRFALARAHIQNPPNRGAHMLRHSAATAMLRAGGSLEMIGAVLRHRSRDMTAHYAKVDVAMLEAIAQPWPGGASC